MKVLKNWGRASVVLAFPIVACGTVVGADFDGLEPAGGASGSGTVGGTSPSNGGSGNSGGGGAAAGTETAGGTNAGNGGTSQGGMSSSAGATAGGAAGEPSGGAPPQGGAEMGGAGSAGENPGGAGAGGEAGATTIGVPPTLVVVNELKGQGSGDDYIELYNTGTEVADLSGCYVADDSNNRVTLPTGATIEPQSYVVIRLQQTTSTGTVTECFGFTPCYDGIQWGISAKGEVIFFHDSHGVLLDTMTYPDETGPNNVGNGNAYGRIPDGAVTKGAIVKSAGKPNVAFTAP